MAAEASRGNADKDCVWVCDTDPDPRWICDYDANRLSEESAFGGSAHDSVEAVGAVGIVGTRRLSADAGLRGLRGQCFEQLQDGHSFQGDDWGHCDQRAAGPCVLVRISGAAVWGGVVLRDAGVWRRADTGMDRHAEGVLPGRIVYRAGWNSGLGGAGRDFEVGLPAFARG